MIYLQLFWAFFRIGLFSFGGGYAALPLLQQEVVEGYKWITVKEFTDLITISQLTPGPIAINAATFIGTRVGGVPGAIIATFGNVLPSVIVITIISILYIKYRNLDGMKKVLTILRPAVIAMILTAGVVILISSLWINGVIDLSQTQWIGVIIFLSSLFILIRFHVDPVKMMIIAGVANLLIKLFIIKG